jgi:alpha-tubulin suppressor-like RCC1 family protein
MDYAKKFLHHFGDEIVDLHQGVECLFVLTREKKVYFLGEITYADNKRVLQTKDPIELIHKDLKSSDIRQIAGGHNHLLVLGKENQIFSFGSH